jgi:hypothetical protein
VSTRIDFERSGGFAGIPLRASLSTQDLPPEQQREFEELIEASHFFELAPAIHSDHPGADRFQYRISVDSGQRSHTVVVDEAAITPGLRALVSWLQAWRKSHPQK